MASALAGYKLCVHACEHITVSVCRLPACLFIFSLANVTYPCIVLLKCLSVLSAASRLAFLSGNSHHKCDLQTGVHSPKSAMHKVQLLESVWTLKALAQLAQKALVCVSFIHSFIKHVCKTGSAGPAKYIQEQSAACNQFSVVLS